VRRDGGWEVGAFRSTGDGQTGADYMADLRGNLERLLGRAKSGTYRAPPVKRVHIPKGTGTETRPIGIPTFEDKVLQRAVVMVLESVYEQDFYDCSYGFRPGRSAHQALEALWRQLIDMGGGWVVEVDIRKFFDTLDHPRLREFLQRRIRDGVLLRLIGKWLNAGVLEGDVYTLSEQGTPQGGVISPLLANVYLHYVLDEWFEQEVKPRLAGRAFLIRYADDFVIGFQHEADAKRVLEVLPKRFAKHGLTLHPESRGHSQGHSTCWGSRTSGAGRGVAAGRSCDRRRRAGSVGRLRGSPNGVEFIGISPSLCSTRRCVRSCRAMTHTTASLATAGG
jgi:RNA-directed DNA polymerase